LIPVAGEEPVVAPVITHVSWVTVQLSAKVAFGTAIVAVHKPGSVFLTMFAGQVTVGGCASTTVTVKEQVLVLPAASVALKVLVVVPTGKKPPGAIPAICTRVGAFS
jgi:hypothetical protein